MTAITLINLALLLGALLVLAGIASSLVASRFGAPLLLVFLAIGMLAGKEGPGGIPFEDYQTTYLIGSLALAVILFDGGLRANLTAFRTLVAPAGALATLGVLVTAALTGLVASHILDLNTLEGLLLGAIVASTDAAAVFFLIRTRGLQLRRRVGATLEIESGLNDPAAVFLTVALANLLVAAGASSGWQVPLTLMSQGLVGAVVGLGGGFALSWVLNRSPLPGGLHPLLVTATAVLIFGVSAVLHGSGFLAVYLAGLILGNRPVRAFPAIAAFLDAATWLAQLVMFTVLGLLATPTTLLRHAGPGLLVAAFLILVGRPAAVWLCLAPFRFARAEKLFIAWVGLRGAVSIFLAAIPTLAGLPNAEVYFNVAFFVVLVSLLVQGWTLTWTARRLGVALAEPAPAPRRIEIDLPGQLEYEMVGYPIAPDSPVRRRDRLPTWVRSILVVRGGAVLTPEQAGRLRGGDYAYFLVASRRIRQLDDLFAPRDREVPDRVSSIFVFRSEVPVAAVTELYGLPLPDDLKGLTIAEAFAARFQENLEAGDVIRLGVAALVAFDVDGGVLISAILDLDDEAGEPWNTPPA
ncbi:potassium/proton antiporter [Methylobacterium oryzisoli]|uniref:potassium/proton antiporter n=1 Tax=Methylobacterium oryzisoli TaxID=3385502 RepID=UPI0038925E84